ncbi:exosome complex component Rrp41 [Nanobdella aerobiophila]|uniref:Exosome complex component Rrp41 n=1 Tax=Nanobdella aerobiophila TaxID=2586965 RepID=A0A915SYJ1_9ARCH|nr:exosome complex exonuclease Rrp41 [Nanobdella aerobiophila]BBL45860.1 exosome complex component Rrp41 [Nanobdella aerobiophila]
MSRFDGRKEDELRNIYIELNPIENAKGSAIFAFGETRVLAAVYGPRGSKMSKDYDRAFLRVKYNMITFSVPERKKPTPGRREIEVSEVIKRAIEPALLLEELPGSIIDVYIEVLNANAGTRTASINAVSLALSLAGIPMRDLVSSVAVGKVGQKILVDLNKDEEDYNSEKLKDIEEKRKFIEFYGEGRATDIPIAYLPYKNEISLIQLDGEINNNELKDAINLGIKSCKNIKNLMKDKILEYFSDTNIR